MKFQVGHERQPIKSLLGLQICRIRSLVSPLGLIDGDIVRTHVPPTHQPIVIEFPMLVAVGTVPLPGIGIAPPRVL